MVEQFGWSTSSNLKIALLSDIHIPRDDSTNEEKSIRDKFKFILTDAVNNKVNLIVIAGDLGQHSGSIESYTWIRNVLNNSKVPYLIIPGNHDQSDLLEQVFPEFCLFHGKLFYQVKLGLWDFAFLDSSPDHVSSEQIFWLERLLENAESGSSWALVMHHPPMLCGCQFMDSHFPLADKEPLLELINRHANVKHIFCGHYHIAKEMMINEHTGLHLSPSSWFQIDDKSPTFEITDLRIGYRCISVKGKSIETKVKMFFWE